jgi:hypothetical protein
MMRALGGEITARNHPEGGAEFVITGIEAGRHGNLAEIAAQH